MIVMEYTTNCVVKAHRVQTVKLTLYKYRSWWHVRCEKAPTIVVYCSLQSTGNMQISDVNKLTWRLYGTASLAVATSDVVVILASTHIQMP